MYQDLVRHYQAQVKLQFEGIRLSQRHPSSKGSNVEHIIREFMKKYLPPNLRIGHGEVIDSYGNRSNQTDVIVVNEYHPFLSDFVHSDVFIAEGVACGGEIKSVLTSNHLGQTLESCTRFKSLRLRVPIGTTTRANPEDRKRFVEHRPYFLFAFKSDLAIETVADRVAAYHSKQQLPIEQQLDAIFLMDRGSIINFGTGGGSFQVITPEGKALSGYVVERGDEKEPTILTVFLIWLSICTPKYMLPYPPLVNYITPYRV